MTAYRAGFAVLAVVVPSLLPSSTWSAPKPRSAKTAIELAPASPTALAGFEVEIGDLNDGATQRLAVTDAALFVSSPRGDVRAVLAEPDGAAQARAAPLFSIRLIVVAGGRLYTGGRGQCGGWVDGVARCTASCDDGIFAIRRNGSAALELMVGAVPGGAAGGSSGLTISACDFDDGGSAKLVAKSGRTLAVAAFGRD